MIMLVLLPPPTFFLKSPIFLKYSTVQKSWATHCFLQVFASKMGNSCRFNPFLASSIHTDNLNQKCQMDLSLHKSCYHCVSVQFLCNLACFSLFSPFLILNTISDKDSVNSRWTRYISQVLCHIFAGFFFPSIFKGLDLHLFSFFCFFFFFKWHIAHEAEI